MLQEVSLLKCGQFSQKYSSLALHTNWESLLKASYQLLDRAFWKGISSFCFEWSGTLGVMLEVATGGDGASTQSGELCCHVDQGEGPVAAGAEEGGVCGAGSCSGGDSPGGMLSRVDVGAFPSSKWKGVTIIPQASGGLALRVVPQAARKARWSLPSSLMTFTSRCWISLACDC